MVGTIAKELYKLKINYCPVVIIFYDDNGNMMRNLWKAYYTYYYNDGRNAAALSGIRGCRLDINWGGGTRARHLLCKSFC